MTSGPIVAAILEKENAVNDFRDLIGSTNPEDAEAGGASGSALCNLAWWDSVSYESLAQWVPTLGRVPRDTLHELGLLRGAVCSELRDAYALGDLQAQTRAEKLLTYLDRLVLHSPRSTRGGKGQLSKIITGRVRLAWAGDWGARRRQPAPRPWQPAEQRRCK